MLDIEFWTMSGAPADRCKMPQAFWRILDHLGLRPAVVLRQARLPATLHLGAQALVTTAQLFAIWKAVEALTQDPGFGLKIAEAADAAGQLATGQAVRTSLDKKLADGTGVSLDTETADMVRLQNAYAANAKVLTAAQAMWTQLLDSVR